VPLASSKSCGILISPGSVTLKHRNRGGNNELDSPLVFLKAVRVAAVGHSHQVMLAGGELVGAQDPWNWKSTATRARSTAVRVRSTAVGTRSTAVSMARSRMENKS
jgi:hypothetical protein